MLTQFPILRAKSSPFKMSLRDVLALEESRPRPCFTKSHVSAACLLRLQQMLESPASSSTGQLHPQHHYGASSSHLLPPPAPLSCVQVGALLPSDLTRNLEEYLLRDGASPGRLSRASSTLSEAMSANQCLQPCVSAPPEASSRVSRLLGAMHSRYKYGGNPNFRRQSEDMLRSCVLETDTTDQEELIEKVDGFLQFAHALCAA